MTSSPAAPRPRTALGRLRPSRENLSGRLLEAFDRAAEPALKKLGFTCPVREADPEKAFGEQHPQESVDEILKEAVREFAGELRDLKKNTWLTALHLAAARGHAPAAYAFARRGGSLPSAIAFGVNDKDADGYTALDWAASGKDPETLRAIAKGAALGGQRVDFHNPGPHQGKTTADRAHQAKSPAAARMLRELTRQATLKALRQAGHPTLGLRDPFGRTLLHLEARAGNRKECAALLREGADPNARDFQGETPAFAAVANADLEGFKLFAQNDWFDAFESDERGNTLMHAAVKAGGEALPVLRALHQLKPRGGGINLLASEVNRSGHTPLHTLAKNISRAGDARKIAAELMEMGANPLERGGGYSETPLEMAIARNNAGGAEGLAGALSDAQLRDCARPGALLAFAVEQERPGLFRRGLGVFAEAAEADGIPLGLPLAQAAKRLEETVGRGGDPGPLQEIIAAINESLDATRQGATRQGAARNAPSGPAPA